MLKYVFALENKKYASSAEIKRYLNAALFILQPNELRVKALTLALQNLERRCNIHYSSVNKMWGINQYIYEPAKIKAVERELEAGYIEDKIDNIEFDINESYANLIGIELSDGDIVLYLERSTLDPEHVNDIIWSKTYKPECISIPQGRLVFKR